MKCHRKCHRNQSRRSQAPTQNANMNVHSRYSRKSEEDTSAGASDGRGKVSSGDVGSSSGRAEKGGGEASGGSGGGGGGERAAMAAAEDFVHLYVDEPRWLRIFLTYVLREGGKAGPTVADTLLELLLRELSLIHI